MAFFKKLSVIFSAKCHFPTRNFIAGGRARPQNCHLFSTQVTRHDRKSPQNALFPVTSWGRKGVCCLKILFPQKPPLAVLLDGMACDGQTEPCKRILAVVNAQNFLEVFQRNHSLVINTHDFSPLLQVVLNFNITNNRILCK